MRAREIGMAAAWVASWLLLLLPGGATAAGGNLQVATFARAKRELARIYREHPTTLYSGCAFSGEGRIIAEACSYVPRRGEGRGGRIEWEHVVPAAALGRGLPAWQRGDAACRDGRGRPYRGRRCAARASVDFRRMEADMYNLVPEIGEVNNLRGNLPMGEMGPRYTILAGLGSRIGDGVFEPPSEVKGDVARITLYMDAAYPELRLLSEAERSMMRRWSAADPTDSWECLRAARIAAVQGNINSFVVATCRAQAGR